MLSSSVKVKLFFNTPDYKSFTVDINAQPKAKI
ncbi:hypothetical protein FBALC1_04487 [Flavobacteriales bacterium ALC-1]|nr:hypothetical protein FBALC1_04487 [Flavobacteriales bacterium ALC-1]